ncbi:MAG: aldo/keto reductase [Rubripirellula sp.]|nr:aldo/keto reductase [Rubripirellula sp.]
MLKPRLILGLWPIAGITTLGVTKDDARATLHAAIDAGVTQFDTAFNYGFQGESDRLLGHVLQERSCDAVVLGKVGQRWTGTRRVIDGRPATLIADAESSLSRLARDSFDCLLLHSPDPAVPIERSAEALALLKQRQLCQRVGVCNVNQDQLRRFSQVIACDAIQCPLNLIQRDSLNDLIPTAQQQGTGVYAFWALMKGMLAGKIGPNHAFDPADPRAGYDIFQGKFRRRADQIVAGLIKMGRQSNRTVAQLAIGWAMAQPGVTAVLAGARKPEQVTELAASQPLRGQEVTQIDRLVAQSARESHRTT